MTPAARIADAIDALARIEAEERPAEGLLRGIFRSRRYIGAKDRRAISDLVYGVLRHVARLDWWIARVTGRSGAARSRVIAELGLCLGASPDELSALFDGSTYHPPALEPAELGLAEALEGGQLDHPEQPLEVRGEMPAWLLPMVARCLGDDLEGELRALSAPAPLDLRVNPAKSDRAAVRQALSEEGITSEPCVLSPLGLRVEGRHTLPSLASYRDGWFEVQDEGSQLVALLTDARPGQAVLDLCAGAGGKTLALAAAMAGEGRLVALDLDLRRLERARPRLARAGATDVELRGVSPDDPWLGEQAGTFDRVLVDAPCSGSGAWRRQPDARWRLTLERLADYRRSQEQSLDMAAPLVGPGGRLIYATCSLIESENQAQCTTFLARHDGFRPLSAAKVWREVLGSDGLCDDDYLVLTPARHGTDGFFVALFEREATS